MTKLDWYEDIDGGWTKEGLKEATVYRAYYKGYSLDVYPAALIDKKEKGWEYNIRNDEKDIDFDSYFESSNGNHADTPKEAMEMAEDTLLSYLSKKGFEEKVKELAKLMKKSEKYWNEIELDNEDLDKKYGIHFGEMPVAIDNLIYDHPKFQKYFDDEPVLDLKNPQAHWLFDELNNVDENNIDAVIRYLKRTLKVLDKISKKERVRA